MGLDHIFGGDLLVKGLFGGFGFGGAETAHQMVDVRAALILIQGGGVQREAAYRGAADRFVHGTGIAGRVLRVVAKQAYLAVWVGRYFAGLVDADIVVTRQGVCVLVRDLEQGAQGRAIFGAKLLVSVQHQHPFRAQGGEIQGGVAHGIGNALYEFMNYDEHAQPQTNTLEEYLLPAVLDVPNVEIVTMESPTPLNPLGIKGAGESGTIPAAAAIIAAIENALQPFKVKISQCPLQAEQIVEMIGRAKAAAKMIGRAKAAAKETESLVRA